MAKTSGINRDYVATFKVISGASFVLGLGLISICFWVLIAFTEHDREAANNPTAEEFRLLSILVNQVDDDGNNRTKVSVIEDNKEDAELKKIRGKLKTAWENVSPYFQGACGFALILGMIQVISSLAILSSSSKGASKPFRATFWKTVHLILTILLVLCVLTPFTIEKWSLEEDGLGIRDHLEALVKHLRRNNKPESSFDTEDVENMTLLYCAIVVDATGVALLVIVCHVLLNQY